MERKKMSLHEYKVSQEIALQDYPFYALVMAVMRQADTDNTELLRQTWPEVWNELHARYHAPGGILQQEKEDERAVGPDGSGGG